jgi:hypothetical protein
MKKVRYARCPQCGRTAVAEYDPHQISHGGHVATHGAHKHGWVGLLSLIGGGAMAAIGALKSCRFKCPCGHVVFSVGN